MMIKIVKTFYRELFWMGMGASIALTASKAVKLWKEKKEQREMFKKLNEMRHDFGDLGRITDDDRDLELNKEPPVTKDKDEEEFLEVETDIVPVDEDVFIEIANRKPEIASDIVYDYTNGIYSYVESTDEPMFQDVEIRKLFPAEILERLIAMTHADEKDDPDIVYFRYRDQYYSFFVEKDFPLIDGGEDSE